jgi:hypothetical protein
MPRSLAAALLVLAVTAGDRGSGIANRISSDESRVTNQPVTALLHVFEEIQTHEGGQRPYPYQREAVEALEADVNQVTDLLVQGALARVASRAEELLPGARRLRDQVLLDHATALFEQAQERIRVADLNLGDRENPDLWATIVRGRDEARQALSEQRGERALTLSQSIIDDVDALLQPLRERALRGQREVRQVMQSFDDLGSAERTPNLVVQVRGLSASVDQLIEEGDYRQAIAVAEQTLARAHQVVTESKRSLADQGVTQIEGVIAQIIQHGGDNRLRQRYEAISLEFRHALELFYQQRFDEVLAQIELLRPRVDQLLADSIAAESRAPDSRTAP